MIVSVTPCATHRRRIRHDPTIGFEAGLNAVIGPNGTGKGAILRALRHCPHCAIERDRETRVVLFHSGVSDAQSSRFRRRSAAEVHRRQGEAVGP